MKSKAKRTVSERKKAGGRIGIIVGGIIVALSIVLFLLMQNRDYISAYLQYRQYEKIPQISAESIQSGSLTDMDFQIGRAHV